MKTLDPKHTDWRKEADDRDPDDELLPQTPADVVAVLGFDPLELEEPAANASSKGCIMAMLPSLDSELPNWAADNISNSDLAADGVETEPHVTVLYGFDPAFDKSLLKAAVQSSYAPLIALGEVGRFECAEYDVLKVAVESQDLIALNSRLANAFSGDITSSEHIYSPHMTIAYVKKGSCKSLDGRKDFKGRQYQPQQALYSLPDKQGRSVFNFDTESANSIFDDRLEAEDRVRRQCEDIYRSAFDSALDSAERELEKKRRREPDWQDWDGIYWDSLFAGLPDALAGAGQLAFKHAATAFNTRLSDPDAGFAAKGFADARRAKLAGVPERVKEAVRSSVSRGLAGGESAQAVSRRVVEAFDGAKEIEGKLVAETEAQVTYGTAMDAALKAAGYASKKWVTVGDERVRESHVACGQQGPVAIGRAFSNGLMFPGDPDGPASEVIACRCHLEGAE